MAPPRLREILTHIGALLCGIGIAVVGISLVTHRSLEDVGGAPLRDTNADYTFIKPLLACNVGATDPSASLEQLHSTFVSIIDGGAARGDTDAVSIYFRLLDSNAWTGVNVDDGYAPASLMKVPILMTYLSMEERDPRVGAESIHYAIDTLSDEVQTIAPDVTLAVGENYTVDELLGIMTTYSDNRARDVLMRYIDVPTLTETLRDFGIPLPDQTQSSYTVSPRLYSRLFRILYNATYLSPVSSERALAMLANTTYVDGLRAGVPDTVTVAHKFGEATFTREDGTEGRELHDCGIVYAASPYTLCVMTKGSDTTTLAKLVKELSAAAYTFTTTP